MSFYVILCHTIINTGKTTKTTKSNHQPNPNVLTNPVPQCDTFRDTDFTTTLGSPFHCITTLSETIFFSDIQPDPMSLHVILLWCGSKMTEIKKLIFIRFSCKQIGAVSAFSEDEGLLSISTLSP